MKRPMKKTECFTMDFYEEGMLSITHYKTKGMKCLEIKRRGHKFGSVSVDVEEIDALISALHECLNEQDKFDEASTEFNRQTKDTASSLLKESPCAPLGRQWISDTGKGE